MSALLIECVYVNQEFHVQSHEDHNLMLAVKSFKYVEKGNREMFVLLKWEIIMLPFGDTEDLNMWITF